MTPSAALAKVRKLCLSFPDVTERLSHGSPAWFIRDKHHFLSFVDDHHGDGRMGFWCAAPAGAQAILIDNDADVFFVPPYVGPSGWVGVRLDGKAPWPMVAEVIEQAYQARLAKLSVTAKVTGTRRRKR